MNKQKATKRSVSVFHQIVQYLPRGLVEKLARKHKIDARKFSETSHVLSLMLGHFMHCFSLNEIVDALAVHANEICRTRGMTAPRRNTLSNANRTRAPRLAEELYWAVFEHLQNICRTFGTGRPRGALSRFRLRNIFAIDSSTLALSLKCMDWAKHRARKAAAKLHMRTDVACMLPRFVIVEEGAHHDSTRALALCEGMGEGDILLADRAYADFAFLAELLARGIFFVLRQKRKLKYKVVKSHPVRGDVISDEEISLEGVRTSRTYPSTLRRVEAVVEVDGKRRPMVFPTNNTQWAASTIADLYRARWTVELLFKELKQTLQLQTFYGENENAVRWQVWTALIVHLILRFIKHVSKWSSSYSRLVGIVRAMLWMKIGLAETLENFVHYGTASPPRTPVVMHKALFLPGFEHYA